MKLRNKIFTIVLIALIIIAIGAIGIGYIIIGADVLSWFTSRYAIWIYTFLMLYVIIWLVLYIWEQIKKL